MPNPTVHHDQPNNGAANDAAVLPEKSPTPMTNFGASCVLGPRPTHELQPRASAPRSTASNGRSISTIARPAALSPTAPASASNSTRATRCQKTFSCRPSNKWNTEKRYAKVYLSTQKDESVYARLEVDVLIEGTQADPKQAFRAYSKE